MKHQPKINKTCQVCGKNFIVLACKARIKPCKYCSVECALIARRRPTKKVKCFECKKEIVLSPWQIKEANNSVGYFCSRKCYGTWRSKNLVGERSPAWKGGNQKYGLVGWKDIREKAKIRDKYICQDCGASKASGAWLDVHHLKPVDMFENENDANRLSNLITLCRKCHYERHKSGIFNEEK